MQLRDFVAHLRRRWYLILVGFVLTGVMATGAYAAVPATYQTKASVLLLPPKSSVGTLGNPFLYLGGLDQALDVLSTRLNAQEVTKPIAQTYPGLSLEVARDATTSGPILVIDATSANGRDTMTVVNELVGAVPSTLASLQDDLQIPDSSRITAMNLTIDREPRVDFKNKIRAVVALGALGLAGTVLFSGLLDSLLAGRRRRRGKAGWAVGERDRETDLDRDLDGDLDGDLDRDRDLDRGRKIDADQPPGWDVDPAEAPVVAAPTSEIADERPAAEPDADGEVEPGSENWEWDLVGAAPKGSGRSSGRTARAARNR